MSIRETHVTTRFAALLEWPAMRRPRIAAVGYLNALPLIWGISRGQDRGFCDLTLAPPRECARLLSEGLVDVGLIPSIEFARTEGLAAVEGLGISSRNEVRSVVLVTRGAPESIGSLAVDMNSRTSVALSRLVLSRRYGCRPRMEEMKPELQPMLAKHDAALLIGDAALSAALGGFGAGETLSSRPNVLDLAREWNQMTGMPFVFAFWACRPQVSPGDVSEVLSRSLEEGMANLARIAAEESERTGMPSEVIASYLSRNIHYRLGPRESESLRVFYRMCREEGILPGRYSEAFAVGTAI